MKYIYKIQLIYTITLQLWIGLTMIGCVKSWEEMPFDTPTLQQAGNEEDLDLLNAVLSNKSAQIKKLLLQGASPNVFKIEGANTALHLAIQNLCYEATSALLVDDRILPNKKNENGFTPLHIAIMNADEKNVQNLLACDKVDPNMQDSHSNTPLHILLMKYKKYLSEDNFEKKINV